MGTKNIGNTCIFLTICTVFSFMITWATFKKTSNAFLDWVHSVLLLSLIGLFFIAIVKDRRSIIQKLTIPDDLPLDVESKRSNRISRFLGYVPFIVIIAMIILNYLFTCAKFLEDSPHEIFVLVFTIAFLNVVNATLEFYMNRRPLKRMTFFFIIEGLLLYAAPAIVVYFNLEVPFPIFEIWEILTLLTFSIFAPGVTLLILGSFKKFKEIEASQRLAGKLHVHESFIGASFLLVAFIVQLSMDIAKRIGVYVEVIILQEIVLSLVILLFLVSGAFGISRDWHDFVRLRFIEKPATKGIAQIHDAKILAFHLPEDQFYHSRSRSPKRLALALCIPICVSLVAHSFGVLDWYGRVDVLRQIIVTGYMGGIALGALLGYMETHVKPYQYFLTPRKVAR